MKRDILDDSVVDLDKALGSQPQEIQPKVDEEFTSWTPIDMHGLLESISYKLPKGYPTIKDGVFTEINEIVIINEALQAEGLPTIPLPEDISATQLTTNPTDLKESLVCLFVDAGLTDKRLMDNYRSCLGKTTDPSSIKNTIANIKKTLTNIVNNYGVNYGIGGYKKMPAYIAQTLSNPKLYKKDLITVNNGVGAAEAIIKMFKMLKPGMVRREDTFVAIRDHAVELINTNYQIKNYYPDNWCPGDIYFFLKPNASKALKTTALNLGDDSLNSYFYGTSNPQGSILAVSLKMQDAQAGKGTTFIKNVVVDGVSPQDKLGKDTSNQQVIKYKDLNRRLNTYYFESDAWKKDAKVFDKVRQSVIQLSKMAPLKNLPVKPNEAAELKIYLNKNKQTLQRVVSALGTKLSKSIDTTTVFQQSYNRFVKNLLDMDVKRVDGNSRDFLKQIEDENKKSNKGKLDARAMQGLLAQKSATYDLASTLIEKWTEKTKQVSPAFKAHLEKVKNPFVAITLFAIAQHGLNPNFYKAIGTNNATAGGVSEFPSNSQVNEKKSVEKLKVVDSPGQAGFYMDYNLTINGHTYKTQLTFRFSKDQIRVEVSELTAI